MDSDNENEGFQHQAQHSFDLVQLVEEPVISQPLITNQKIKDLINEMQPPISTYVQMKNCPTPSCLNNTYSYQKDNNIKIDIQTAQKARIKTNVAWCCDQQKYISDQFNEDNYKLIYSKFSQERSNYRFFRQYARHQYKTFEDEDNIEESQDQLQRSSALGRASKLDFIKIQRIINAKDEIKQLHFRSNFEGGNLQKVYIKEKADHQQNNYNVLKKTSSTLNQSLGGSQKRNSKITQSIKNEKPLTKQDNNIKSQKQYFIILSNDTNTIGFNQWFYFKVHNPNYDKQIKATFVITNINKKTIQNLQNIGIETFSMNRFKFEKQGWSKLVDGICVNNKNNLMKDQINFYHTLQFQDTIQPKDTVYFALTIPYTYTKLQSFIDSYPQNFQTIGTTFCGNPLHVYKIGSQKATKSILITARQHPSETSSSFVVEGMIKKLSSSSLLINILKKRYQIYVVPMVNPDGVIHGNSRTNLLGFDINRKWETLPNKRHSYEVFNLIHGLLKKIPKVQYLIDLHGHSKKLNTFAYFSTKKSLATLIGLQMAQKLPWFSINDCQMTTSAPPNTLRWHAATNFAIQKAITIQTSIHGWRDVNKKVRPFTPQSLQQIGSTLVEVISKIQLQKKANIKVVKNVNFAQCHESSDSDPEGDYLRQINMITSKQESPRKEKDKNSQTVSHKLRIKTFSTNFYKPTLNSSMRQRVKTQMNQFTADRMNIQLKSPRQRQNTKKKKVQSKIFRSKQRYVTSIRKITVKYSDIEESLTCQRMGGQQGEIVAIKGNSNKILYNMGKILKKKLQQSEQERLLSTNFLQKIERPNLKLSNEFQGRKNQLINSNKMKGRQTF